MFKTLGGQFKDISSKGLAAYAAGLAVIFYVFLWKLGNLTPGLSPAEVTARGGSQTLHNIYVNPINAPHKFIQYLLTQLKAESFISLRVASVFFAVFFAFCFYKLAVGWFGRAIGLFGSLFFISLPLFVVSARQASAEIMLFSPVALMWLYAWLNKSHSRKSLAWVSLLAAAALLVYVPGMLWWIAAGLVVCRKRIITSVSSVPARISALGLLLAAGLISPLVLSIINRPQLIKNLALIPGQWAAPLQVAKNIGWMILSLFIKTPGVNPLIIGRLPLFNVLLIALLVFGVYAMQGVARLKALLLALSIVFAVIIAGINSNPVLLAFGIPTAGIFISAGLRYLYIEWRSIFPRNPVPRTFALLLIAAVSASQLYFGLSYSLVAWPHSAATRSSYVLK